jgi:hypothetical protein
MGNIIHSFTPSQVALLDKLEFGNSTTWPDIPEQLDKSKVSHTVNVAVMTYVSEMFAWYAGSLDADTYFCPERHGMYFGGFGMKTAPAMGKKDYSISTALTGNSGEQFLNLLNVTQRKEVTRLIDLQRPNLDEIVKLRRNISTELRRFQTGDIGNKEKVIEWSMRYGELDGEMSYLYASAFANVGQTLSAEQKEKLSALRVNDPADAKGPFLYSASLKNLNIGNTDHFFGVISNSNK